MNENQDLLDLCRLNLMEENIQDSPAADRDVTLRAIDWAKRQLVIKIKPCEISEGAMDRHIERNTRHGVYPWTETLPEIIEDEDSPQ